jgi:hypothetical protein
MPATVAVLAPPLIRLPILLVNGGVTILAILAQSYFTKTLIDAIAKLLEKWKT